MLIGLEPERSRGRIIRAALISGATLAVACTPQQRPHTVASAASTAAFWNSALVDTLLRLVTEDQSGRAPPGPAIAPQDTAAISQSTPADTARSLWLRRVVQEHGWPMRASVGDSAAQAAWLVLQHSPFHEWQGEMLPTIERLAASGELPRSNFALFADRVYVRRGQPQRYGSHFDVVDGRLVPAPIADLEQLDARRAAVGLQPMEKYVRMIREVYKLPVVWPPPR